MLIDVCLEILRRPAIRFGLNLLLLFPAIPAGIGASILRDIRSERYYVHDTLTLNNWDVTKRTEEELGEMFDLNKESFYVGNTIDGVSYARKFFGLEFSTETARRNHGVVVRKVDRMIRDLLQLHDLVADSAEI